MFFYTQLYLLFYIIYGIGSFVAPLYFDSFLFTIDSGKKKQN